MEKLPEILKNFPNKKVIVIGDIMLDKTIIGDVSRISPEAPVQIVNVKEEIYEPGGAANVAANISSLRSNAYLFGFTGRDDNAKILSKILNERKIEYFFDENFMTTLKVRIRGRNQQLVRLDYEDISPKNFTHKAIEMMKDKINNSDVILISDYAKGAITADLMNFLKSYRKKIIVDPKPQNMHFYYDCFLIAPNEKEALEMSMQKDVYDAGRHLKEKLNCNILITRGEKGMTLFSDREVDIPTYAREVYDITGAGDTAVAALSLSLASGASLEEAMMIANHVAGIAVEKVGTYQVRLSELEKRISGEEGKLKTFEELYNITKDLKKKGRKIVWTNGKFDILHAGHVKYLKKAKERGDYLILGLNSDSSFELIKDRKPINNELHRAEVLLAYTDALIIFSEPDTTRYLSVFKPDVYVKGGNYNIDTINQPERRVVEGYGGKIVIIKTDEDISTTKIIEKIKNLK